MAEELNRSEREMIDDVKANPKSYTCFSCRLLHARVECEGIWHCPNALCTGCGGAWFRQTLDSYKECSSATHTVDEDEWLPKGILHNKKNKIKRTTFHRTQDKME